MEPSDHLLRCEPMDVDTSTNSVSKMDISNDSSDKILDKLKTENDADTNLNSTTNNRSKNSNKRNRVKRYHIKIPRKDRNHQNPHTKYLPFCFFAFFIVLASILVHNNLNIHCINHNNITHVEEMLSLNLYGQENAVKVITEALSKNVSSKIIFLYGTTGVGKTYATSIILEKYLTAVNFYHYTMPNFVDPSTEFMFGMALCRTSVIVVDDLKPKDMTNVKTAIYSIIERSEGLSKNTTVILIFNCEDVSQKFDKKCDDTFLHHLKETFRDSKADKTFVKFNKLTNKHLKQCIEKELNGKRVSFEEMSDILKNFDVSLDGCKGVHTRVKFLHLI